MRSTSLANHFYKPLPVKNSMQSLKGRSRFIDRLKFGLPGIALAVFLVLIFWPQFRQWHYSKQPNLAQTTVLPVQSNTATHPEYMGTDKNNQPYTITADRGQELSSRKIELTGPKMSLVLRSGEKMTLSSSSGTLDKITRQVQLTGNVILADSQGYTLETSRARIDCTDGSAHTNKPVWGKGPLGSIQAQGFWMTGSKICFTGGAELLLMAAEGKSS